MAQIRYRGSAGNQAMPLDMGRDIVAVYDDAKRTIYLPEGWSGVTPAEQSLLVHEMVHHLQNLGNLKYACSEAREKLAFAAQEQWLRIFGASLAVNSISILLHCWFAPAVWAERGTSPSFRDTER
jgi:hypothetical protein